MHISLKYLLFSLFIVTLTAADHVVFSQQVGSLTPVVLGSAGGDTLLPGNNLRVSFTVGETVVSTAAAGNNIFTQGFHQPSVSYSGTLVIEMIYKDANCRTASNGEARATILNGTPPYTYAWSPSGGNGSSATGLSPGTYYLYVTDNANHEGRDTVTIGAIADDACDIHVYKGITPNGDGMNDAWHIDGITLFPDNKVTLYNRWGEKVWQIDGYNNDDKQWKGNDLSGDKLPDGTYYYVLEIPGADTWRGWVQVTR